MRFILSICVGAGVGAYVYNTFARRVGYSNTKNVVVLIGSIFILVTIVAYTIFAILKI